MSGKIKNSAELREFLSSMMLGIKNGDIDADKARNITKMAGQINENFYVEIKVAQVRAEAGQKLFELGAMPIGKEDA